LQAKNALLQQQIMDAENISLERHKQLNKLETEIDNYKERITTRSTNLEGLKADYKQVEAEITELNDKLTKAYREKQYLLNEAQM